MIVIPRFRLRRLPVKERIMAIAITVGLAHLYIMVGITAAVAVRLQAVSWFLLYIILLTAFVTFVAYRYVYKPMETKDD